jgi:hypothetical protein
MDIQVLDQSTEAVLQRIDAIMRELVELREVVLRKQTEQPPADNLAQQLYGVLGHGNWNEYDFDLDWQRFNA